MKKLTFILVILLVGVSGFAKAVSENYYVIYTGEKLYCKKIQVDKDFINAVLDNGQKVVIPASQIKMYQVNGEIFEKLPVYVNNVNTNQQVFMQFVATRAGLRLYKYTMRDDIVNKETGAHEKGRKVEHSVIFRGDQFYGEITDKNYQTMMEFFRVI